MGWRGRNNMRVASFVALGAGLLIMGGCSREPERPSFSQLATQFVYDTLAMSPVTATATGYHQHNGVPLDELIDDYSEAVLDGQRRYYEDFRRQLLADVRREDLSAQDQADYDILNDQTELALLELNTIRSYKHNPTLYVELIGNALFTPFVVEYAPEEQRWKHIIARLDKVPDVVAEAKRNLVDSPAVWRRVALEENNGNIALIDRTLRQAVPPSQRLEFEHSARLAIESLLDFNAFLDDTLAQHPSDWRLGKENYARKFRYVLGTGRTPDQVLADAEAAMKDLRAKMARLAGPASVKAALDKVAARHASPQTYFDDARRDLAEATGFVRDHKLLRLPERSNLQVIETPEFMRGIYAVGGFDPAPALEPQLGAFYWITPIPAGWPKDRIESKLREYNFYGLKILTLHEAMPGHYVQFEYANHVQPTARRIVRSVFSSGPYVEGWAVYATQMMVEEGYYNEDVGMQLTYLKQMLRAVANTILDIRLQTMGMTEQEAMKLMVDDTYQEKEEATAKLQRAELSSCQLPTYFAGWREWLRVRDQYKQAKGASFSLADFHEKALAQGGVPLRSLAGLLSEK